MAKTFIKAHLLFIKWEMDPNQVALPIPHVQGLDVIVNPLSYFTFFVQIPRDAKSFAIHLLHDAPEWHEYSQ
jgi:hypothetical protein